MRKLVRRSLNKLHALIYEFMWRSHEKQRESIEGASILYVQLPWWLLLGGIDSNKRFVGGMCIVRKRVKTPMIFVARKERAHKTFRYTLYHEYIEGQLILGKPPHEYTMEEAERKLQEAINDWIRDVPDLDRYYKKAIKRHKGNRAHLVALTFELALARKEMGAPDFSEYLADVMKNRI